MQHDSEEEDDENDSASLVEDSYDNDVALHDVYTLPPSVKNMCVAAYRQVLPPSLPFPFNISSLDPSSGVVRNAQSSAQATPLGGGLPDLVSPL